MKHWNKKTHAGLALLAALLWILPARLSADTTAPQKTASTAKRKSDRSPKHSTHSTHGPATGTGQHQSAKHPATRHVSSKATPPQHRIQKASARSSQHPSAHRPATRHVSSRARRAAAERRRRARMRPEPERIQEIQRALVQAGYSKEEPNGRWDEQTREAMRRYQADHGFPTTGLPEAKSLMKLGLGPHPLPADVDTGSGPKAGADTLSNTPAPSSTQQNPP